MFYGTEQLGVAGLFEAIADEPGSEGFKDVFLGFMDRQREDLGFRKAAFGFLDHGKAANPGHGEIKEE
jgi:hypothetical protein